MQGQVLREFARMEAVKAACQDPASLEHAIAMRAFQRIETIVQVGAGLLRGISRDACMLFGVVLVAADAFRIRLYAACMLAYVSYVRWSANISHACTLSLMSVATTVVLTAAVGVAAAALLFAGAGTRH
jgi:hypothetical protein